MTNVSVAEGKKNFSRLISSSLEKNEEIVVTRRGHPVAVIIPYEQYQSTRKMEGYKKIMAARSAFLKTSLKAENIFKESKKQLEKRL